MISELTYKIVTLEDIIQFDPNECIDWAIEMIELGHDSPNLLMLASLQKPSNYFEVREHVKNALEELGLQIKHGEDAVKSYSYYFIKQIAKNDNVRQNLTELYKLCQARDYEESVYDFYLLYWAWDELDYHDTSSNAYWDGVTRTNIEDKVVEYARNWINQNESYYTQHHV